MCKELRATGHVDDADIAWVVAAWNMVHACLLLALHSDVQKPVFDLFFYVTAKTLQFNKKESVEEDPLLYFEFMKTKHFLFSGNYTQLKTYF